MLRLLNLFSIKPNAAARYRTFLLSLELNHQVNKTESPNFNKTRTAAGLTHTDPCVAATCARGLLAEDTSCSCVGGGSKITCHKDQEPRDSQVLGKFHWGSPSTDNYVSGRGGTAAAFKPPPSFFQLKRANTSERSRLVTTSTLTLSQVGV